MEFRREENTRRLSHRNCCIRLSKSARGGGPAHCRLYHGASRGMASGAAKWLSLGRIRNRIRVGSAIPPGAGFMSTPAGVPESGREKTSADGWRVGFPVGTAVFQGVLPAVLPATRRGLSLERPWLLSQLRFAVWVTDGARTSEGPARGPRFEQCWAHVILAAGPVAGEVARVRKADEPAECGITSQNGV